MEKKEDASNGNCTSYWYIYIYIFIISFFLTTILLISMYLNANETARQKTNQDIPMTITRDCETTAMDFDVIATATQNFSKGGFGIVYKVTKLTYIDIFIYL